jgi:hypothetical protein
MMVSSEIEEDETLLGLPPPATLRALAEQNTDELRVEARRFAESRVRYVRGVGQPIPKDYATELVDDAITSTWLGIARWDPERCSLLVHVRSAILDRTSKEIRRCRRFPHVPIHAAANDSSDAAQVEHALASDGNRSPIAFVGLVFRVASELKVVAHSDANIQALLGCWHAGVVERDDVMARTGLTPAAYKAARKRLLSLSKRLPADLCESARELLRSAS